MISERRCVITGKKENKVNLYKICYHQEKLVIDEEQKYYVKSCYVTKDIIEIKKFIDREKKRYSAKCMFPIKELEKLLKEEIVEKN